MKSQLISSFSLGLSPESAKVFKQDLKDLIDSFGASRELYLQQVPSLRSGQSEPERKKIVSNLAEKAKTSLLIVEHSLSMLNFFSGCLVDEEPVGDSGSWAEDLIELGWLDQSHFGSFQNILSAIRSILPSLKDCTEERRARSGVLPTIRQCKATVEARTVRRGEFEWGGDISNYKPDIIGVTLIASVHIELDDGSPNDFFFQADPMEINRLIATLEAVKKEFSSLNKYLKLEELNRKSSNA